MCSGRESCSCSIYASCFELFRYHIQGIVDIHPMISFYHQLAKRRHFFSEYQPFYLCSVWSQYVEQQTMEDLTCHCVADLTCHCEFKHEIHSVRSTLLVLVVFPPHLSCPYLSNCFVYS